MRLATLLVVLLLSSGASAQPVPGSCENGRTEARLDVGDVVATVFNTGSLFYGNQTEAGYKVPRASGNSPVYASGLWLAGTVGSEVRAAAATYENFQFWPGPLGADARPVDPADCAPYDRIYVVSRADIAAYGQSGNASPDLRDWPWDLGAPVIDGDGDPSNYNLAGGDEPALLGDQTAWWIMNDVGGPHTALESDPLGVEVRAEVGAFAFDALRRFSQTTLYRYTITNRTEAPIDSMYAGLHVDADLGDAGDDFMGTDTTRSMIFFYNGQAMDSQYGIPPAIGAQVLVGPVGLANGRDDDRDGQIDEAGERLGIASGSLFIGGFVSDDPRTAVEYFNRLRGRWNDGSRIRASGNGYGQPESVPVVPVPYAGDPVTNAMWSERNPGPFSSNVPGDRGSFVGTGPFRLGPGESESVTFALPFGQGTSNLDSITRLREAADLLRAAQNTGLFDARRVNALPPPPPESDDVRLGRPAPNPFFGQSTIRYQAPTGTPMRATLHDVLGRRLAILADGPTEAPSGDLVIDGTALAPGVYRVRVTIGSAERLLTLTRGR